MWSSNSLLLKEKVWVLSFLWRGGGDVWRDGGPVSSTGFHGLLSSTRCVGVTRTAFRFFAEEVVPYVAVDLMSLWEEVSSGSSLVTILNWSTDVDFWMLKIINNGKFRTIHGEHGTRKLNEYLHNFLSDFSCPRDLLYQKSSELII